MSSGVGGIAFRKQINPQAEDKKLHDVAELYEQQFMREMVKAMRGTVQESGLIKVGQAEKIYKEQLDHNYVEKWSKSGGMGLSNLIYQQLVEKYGAKLGIKGAIEKPQGPIQLNEKANFTGKVQSAPHEEKISYQFAREPSEAPQLVALKAPWAGTVLGAKQLNPDEYFMEMLHDNGLKSQFVFRGSQAFGQGAGFEPKTIQAGETIGLLSPEAKNFSWNVESLTKDGPKHRNENVSE